MMELTSCCSSVASSSESTGLKRRMSSAYKMILAFLDSESSDIGSIKMLNRSGPRIEPCGTPEVTGTGLEAIPFRTTHCLLP